MFERKPHVRIVQATGEDSLGRWEYVKYITYNINHDKVEYRREYVERQKNVSVLCT